jgi:hypothetical protein
MPHDPANATVTSFNTLDGLGYFPFARHYSGNHYCFLFHQLLRCFSSLSCFHTTYEFSCGYPNITWDGLPHSEIHGYWVISTYPWLIAGSHVLHQLPVPRHPPCALNNLTKIFIHRIELYSLVYIFFRLSKTLFQNKLEICFYSFNLSKNKYHQQCW